ncbi:putative NADPH-dependent methylglyoxal reductase GRP2 [Spathaspora sp. JA1]|nr:putative NADPH-dependent methylglyoxal reductase GRP2 [Spathaspora sp. JA1]
MISTLTLQTKSLHRMTSIFVSGANGFIAQHIVKQLLEKGYNVVGTVRSASKGEDLKKLTQSEKFSYEVVPDIGAVGAFDEALKKHPEVSVFLHTASPVTFTTNDVENDLLLPAVNGTKHALQAITAYGPQIKRVVVTSSVVAVFGWYNHFDPNKTYTEEDWNPITWEESLENPATGYFASKKYAELAAWDYVKEKTPHFKISFVNPVFVLGPQAFEVKDKSELNFSAEIVNKVIKLGSDDTIPEFSGTFIDVRDVARAHIIAFEKEDAINKRLLLISDGFTNEGLALIINKSFPESTVPKGDPIKDSEQLLKVHKYDNSKTKQILGFKFISLENSVIETQLIEKNYIVIGSVRSDKKGDELAANLNSSNFSYVVVPDIGVSGAFDEALKTHPEITIFIHTASPFHFNVTDVEKELLVPAIDGTKNALKSVVKYAPQVTHVVVTSSFAAIGAFGKYLDPSKVFTEADWNPQTWEDSLSNPGDGYLGSKKFAEKAAWDFVETEEPNFKLSTVNPPYVFGPQAFPIKTKGDLNTSSEVINGILKLSPSSEIPENQHLFVDVRDVAAGHISAFENPDAAGKRLFIVTAAWSAQGIANIIHKNFNKLKNIPVGEPWKDTYYRTTVSKFDNSKTIATLKVGLIPLDVSVIDSVQQILEAK